MLPTDRCVSSVPIVGVWVKAKPDTLARTQAWLRAVGVRSTAAMRPLPTWLEWVLGQPLLWALCLSFLNGDDVPGDVEHAVGRAAHRRMQRVFVAPSTFMVAVFPPCHTISAASPPSLSDGMSPCVFECCPRPCPSTSLSFGAVMPSRPDLCSAVPWSTSGARDTVLLSFSAAIVIADTSAGVTMQVLNTTSGGSPTTDTACVVAATSRDGARVVFQYVAATCCLSLVSLRVSLLPGAGL
jgi:hypothetical protein